MFSVFAWKWVSAEIYTYIFTYSKKIKIKRSLPSSIHLTTLVVISMKTHVTYITLLLPLSHWQFATFEIHLTQSQQPWPCQSWFQTILEKKRGKVTWWPSASARSAPWSPHINTTCTTRTGSSAQLLIHPTGWSLSQQSKLLSQSCSVKWGFWPWLQPSLCPTSLASPPVSLYPTYFQSLSKTPNHIAIAMRAGVSRPMVIMSGRSK